MQAQNLPTSAAEYSRAQRAEIQAAVAAVNRQWRRMGKDFDTDWARIAPTITAIMATAQTRLIAQSDDYIPAVLEETGQVRAIEPVAATNRSAFVGVTGAGYAVSDSLAVAPIRAKQAIAGGASLPEALSTAGVWLSASAGTILSDTGRAVEATGMYTRDVSGYVRMLTPPSCGRCVIQAGKWFRKNRGFQRHPRCDCRHIPASEVVGDDIRVNPGDYFDSLSETDQAKVAGSRANARAVRDGADFGQLVNAYAPSVGMRFAQVSPIQRVIRRDGSVDKFSKITSRSASFKAADAARSSSRFSGMRLMPESIYRTARNREDALRLLRINGWIL